MFLHHILCMIFSRKMLPMLYSINWPKFNAWLPLLLEISDIMYSAIVCFPGWDVTNFEINLIFLIRLFLYITKKSRRKFENLQKEMSFKGKIKSIFHHFKGFSFAKKCLRLESTPLTQNVRLETSRSVPVDMQQFWTLDLNGSWTFLISFSTIT